MAPHADGGATTAAPQSEVPGQGLSSKKPRGYNKSMEAFPMPPRFEDKYEEREYLKGQLAAAFRIFGKLGYDQGVAGHITLRDPIDHDCFWVNPFGVPFALINRSDLILVDGEGNVLEGGNGGKTRLLNRAAFMIHSAIHDARPDVICAAHSHPFYGRAWCTIGRNIDILHQDSCPFYEEVALCENFDGVVVAEKQGQDIAKALGPKKAAILQNHGLLTVGQTVEEALWWFKSLEDACHTQLLVEAVTNPLGQKPVPISREEALDTRKTMGSPMAGWFNGKTFFDVIHRELGGEYLQ